MTRDEAKKIVMIIYSTYPNWKPGDLTFTVDAWSLVLEEYPYDKIALALKMYIIGDEKGFAPSPGQLIEKYHSITHQDDSELQAWSLVYKAICNSNYNSEEEFAKLPKACQMAVGNPANLREWAAMAQESVETVEQSHFIRSYRAAVQRLKDEAKMPESMRAAIASARQQELGEVQPPEIESSVGIRIEQCDDDAEEIELSESVKQKLQEMRASFGGE